jgi:hypothetical protein
MHARDSPVPLTVTRLKVIQSCEDRSGLEVAIAANFPHLADSLAALARITQLLAFVASCPDLIPRCLCRWMASYTASEIDDSASSWQGIAEMMPALIERLKHEVLPPFSLFTLGRYLQDRASLSAFFAMLDDALDARLLRTFNPDLWQRLDMILSRLQHYLVRDLHQASECEAIQAIGTSLDHPILDMQLRGMRDRVRFAAPGLNWKRKNLRL